VWRSRQGRYGTIIGNYPKSEIITGKIVIENINKKRINKLGRINHQSKMISKQCFYVL
jgi:hypothetical protein